MASLAATFGRGAMTNGWVDIKNADVILAMGGNPAENHPVGFKVRAWKPRNREREARRGRSALHPDGGRRRRLRPDPRRHGHRLPRRDHPVRAREALPRGLRQALHQRVVPGDGRYGFDEEGLFSGFDGEQKATTTRPAWAYELDETKAYARRPDARSTRAASSSS